MEVFNSGCPLQSINRSMIPTSKLGQMAPNDPRPVQHTHRAQATFFAVCARLIPSDVKLTVDRIASFASRASAAHFDLRFWEAAHK
jgi:hypothetical protein